MERTRENNAEQPAEEAARSAGEAAAAAAQRVGESFEHGKDAMAEMQAAVVERTRECVQTTEMYVRENPWQAIGIAAGAGLVLGLLMARR